MENVQVRIKKLAPDLPLPSYQTPFSSGVDLYAAVHEPVSIDPGMSALIPSGICIALPEGYEAQTRPRSGLALKSQISIVNSPGTIDADYRGEIKIILINHGREPFVVKRGDRVAQLVFAKVPKATFVEASELDETLRNDGGFGSTG